MEEQRKAIFALTSRSNNPKIGERILRAHTTLESRSRCAQMGKKALKWGKIALLVRHEFTMIALFFELKFICSH